MVLRQAGLKVSGRKKNNKKKQSVQRKRTGHHSTKNQQPRVPSNKTICDTDMLQKCLVIAFLTFCSKFQTDLFFKM